MASRPLSQKAQMFFSEVTGRKERRPEKISDEGRRSRCDEGIVNVVIEVGMCADVNLLSSRF